MTALSGEGFIGFEEVFSFADWVAQVTGHLVIRDPGLGPNFVEIDHDRSLIKINGYLDPVATGCALSMACRRIVMGAAWAPEFLRLVQ